MTPADVQTWLNHYIKAWRTYDREKIEGLFSPHVIYSYHPWDKPLKGPAAIAESWLADQDPPDSWKAKYRPDMIEGHRATATGTTTYSDGRVFWNLWELEFDEDGLCTRFVEWFMLQPNR